MPETRKLAAILAADVVGYSRLAGADEERTLARLRGLRAPRRSRRRDARGSWRRPLGGRAETAAADRAGSHDR